jgi:hypothetical protein
VSIYDARGGDCVIYNTPHYKSTSSQILERHHSNCRSRLVLCGPIAISDIMDWICELPNRVNGTGLVEL